VKRVLLLLPKGTEVFEMAAFYDVLGWASAEGSEPIQVTTVGLGPEVRCTFGLRVVPDKIIGEVAPGEYDALAVPGGFEEHGYYEEAYSEAVLDLIRQFRDRPVCSICVGALPVAASGILDGRSATTYHLGGSVRRRQLAELGVEVLDQQVVQDGLVTTSTSPATAVDVALGLVAQLTSQENADHVRHLMGFGPRL
jgi:4-methyl-5(b-hydroxyethyl)-thiazole monophosphate biosynthesis